jgi:hypothetical protein
MASENSLGISFQIVTLKKLSKLFKDRQNAHFFKNGHFLMQIMQPSSPKQVWISSI